MILRDCLVRSGIVDSERVCALKPATQLFFRNILHVCDGAARFEADADRLRTVLYGRSLHVVAKRDVARWMTECHLAGLIRLYTRSGRGYGEVINYGQRDTKRRKLYPGPHDDELNFAAPISSGDEPEVAYPAPPPLRKKRSEEKGRETREALIPLPAPAESHEDWLARVQAAWPGVNIAAELARAQAKKAKAGEALERGWFEAYWLPKCTAVVTKKEIFAPKVIAISEGEPEGWRDVLEGTPLGDEVKAWSELSASQQAFVRGQLKQRRAG